MPASLTTSPHLFIQPTRLCSFTRLLPSCHRFRSRSRTSVAPSLSSSGTMLTTLASPTDLSTPVPQSPTPPVFVSASPMSSEPSLIRKVSLESSLQNFNPLPPSPVPLFSRSTTSGASATPSVGQVDGRRRRCGAGVQNRPRLQLRTPTPTSD